jgi:hypothetical protein
MMGKMLSNWMTKKALIWAGAGVLSLAAIPAVGATAHRLTHKKAGVTHRTASHSTLHRATGKATALTTKSRKATGALSKHNTGKALAAVNSMHSGHAVASKSTKLGTHAKTGAKALSSKHKAKASGLSVASAHHSASHLGALESPTDLRASRKVAIR